MRKWWCVALLESLTLKETLLKTNHYIMPFNKSENESLVESLLIYETHQIIIY